MVEEGLRAGFSDALVVKECVEEGWIRVEELDGEEEVLSQRTVEHAGEIHIGEAQAIILARRNVSLLLMDESSGRALAESWGLNVRGTLYVILSALKEGLLDKRDAEEAVSTMVDRGMRIEPRLLTRILKEIKYYKPMTA